MQGGGGGDEDYMSAAFVEAGKDQRPGLVVSHAVRAQRRLERRHNELNAQHRARHVPRAVVEQQNREAALSSALPTHNRGFALLQRMGYRAGQGLGKSGTGITEPIPVQPKADRGGVGREKEKERQVAERQRRRQQQQAKCSVEEYRTRVRNKLEDRQTEEDLRKSRGACEQLDQQKGVREPLEPWFWMQPEPDEDEDDEDDEEEDDDDQPNRLQKQEMLQKLTGYLRSEHFYCIWCGTSYEDRDDLDSNCPGSTAEDHN
ncbi:G patch domain-containing protein 11-like [Lethenteron reissneri]|uniref:G patch domain-containing protein 11-like n=1 Tax=Lethenteron reissneri TaxID=7753 RepID=UPI002AB6E354|nr:G patch domain-containing protein 11-like [Lethenteron reissneri]XP_061405683.1 G patch domain-containing protein 11-like [Lethenteron reissneri]